MTEANNPLTLAAFRAFALAKPKDERYDFFDHLNCPIAQFLKEEGIATPYIAGYTWNENGVPGGENRKEIPKEIRAAFERFSQSKTTTWGDLAEALEEKAE